jgi:hypothetical protein
MATAMGLPSVGGHIPYSLISKEILSDGYTVSCIRNPYGRLVSWYKFHCEYGNPLIYKHDSVDGFMEWVYMGMPNDFWMNHWASHPYEQWRWLCNSSGDLAVDIVLKMENLKEDWSNIVMNRFDVGELPHINSSPDYNWMDYYDRPTAQKATTHVYMDLVKLSFEELVI